MLKALAVALMIGGCAGAPDDTIDVTFDPCRPLAIEPGADTSAAEMRSLDAAMALWNDAAGTQLGRGPHDPQDPAVTVQFERSSPFFFGVYDDEAGAIFVSRSLRGEVAMAITVAHELGHAFGLLHVDAGRRASLMNPANLEVPPSAEDAEDLQEIWGDCRVREGPPP